MMISRQLIENILHEIGISKEVCQEIAMQYRILPRNRGGASVAYVMSSSSELCMDIYVKIYEDEILFSREIAAIKLLTRGKSSKQGLSIVPRVLYTERNRRILVTEAIPGLTLSDILKHALRLDKIFSRRKIALSSIFATVEELIGCLNEIYVSPSEFPDGYNHSPCAVLERVRNKWKRLPSFVKSNTFSKQLESYLENLASFLLSNASKNKMEYVYVHGDFCPKNIVVKDGKGYLLDFEDSGYGSPGRDMAYLIHLLQGLQRHPLYYGYRTKLIIEKLSHAHKDLFNIPEAIRNLWELEWLLDEILLISNSVDRLRRRHVLRKIRMCRARIKKLVVTA